MIWLIADRRKRGHALSSSQRKRHHKISSERGKVEFPFQVIKCQWKYLKTRYKEYGSVIHLVRIGQFVPYA